MKFLQREHQAGTVGDKHLRIGECARGLERQLLGALAWVRDLEKFSGPIYVSSFGDGSNNNKPTPLVVFHREDGKGCI